MVHSRAKSCKQEQEINEVVICQKQDRAEEQSTLLLLGVCRTFQTKICGYTGIKSK